MARGKTNEPMALVQALTSFSTIGEGGVEVTVREGALLDAGGYVARRIPGMFAQAGLPTDEYHRLKVTRFGPDRAA